MDGVLCDFYGAAKKALITNPTQKYPQSEYGFFLNLKPIKGAIESVNELRNFYDVYILTKPSSKNLLCYTEKAAWILNHFDYELQQKIIIIEDKSMVKGDYLVDDQINANQELFEGKLIRFGQPSFENWSKVKKYLIKELKK